MLVSHVVDFHLKIFHLSFFAPKRTETFDRERPICRGMLKVSNFLRTSRRNIRGKSLDQKCWPFLHRRSGVFRLEGVWLQNLDPTVRDYPDTSPEARGQKAQTEPSGSPNFHLNNDTDLFKKCFRVKKLFYNIRTLCMLIVVTFF